MNIKGQNTIAFGINYYQGNSNPADARKETYISPADLVFPGENNLAPCSSGNIDKFLEKSAKAAGEEQATKILTKKRVNTEQLAVLSSLFTIGNFVASALVPGYATIGVPLYIASSNVLAITGLKAYIDRDSRQWDAEILTKNDPMIQSTAQALRQLPYEGKTIDRSLGEAIARQNAIDYREGLVNVSQQPLVEDFDEPGNVQLEIGVMAGRLNLRDALESTGVRVKPSKALPGSLI